MKTILSLKGQFDIFVLSPVPHAHIESGTSFRTVLVGNLDAAHHDDASLRLCGNLIGHVEIERRQVFPVLQAYFKLQGIFAFGSPCSVVLVRIVRYAERMDAGLRPEIFHGAVI